MNKLANKEEYEKGIKNLKFVKRLKNIEAMLVLQWDRTGIFDVEHDCIFLNEVEFINKYDSDVEIIIYTKDKKYFIESTLFGDSYLSFYPYQNRYNYDIYYNHIFAKELLDRFAPHKLEWFFKERIKGYIQIPVNVSLGLTHKQKYEFNIGLDDYQYKVWYSGHSDVVSEYIIGYVKEGEDIGKEIREIKTFAYITDIQKLGEAIEFEELDEKDIVLEDKFNFAPRFKKNQPYNVEATQMYKEHIIRYKTSRVRRFSEEEKHKYEYDMNVWIDLMQHTKKIKPPKPINLADLRPDYVKFCGLWATTRYTLNFDRIEGYIEGDLSGHIKVRQGGKYVEYKVYKAKDYKYIILKGKKYRLTPRYNLEYYNCEVPILSKPYGASKVVATMLIALPYQTDFEEMGFNTYDCDRAEANWLFWIKYREEFIRDHPNALSPNHYAIFIHNILPNNIAEVSICMFNVLNPKEPNYTNLKYPLYTKCYMTTDCLAPMPDFNRDEGGIMYPIAKFAYTVMEDSEYDTNSLAYYIKHHNTGTKK